MRLAGKVAIISGGARGQGAAEARLFAREGAAVVIGDILDEEGLKLEAEIRETGGRVTYVHLDVTEPEQWGSAVTRAVSEYGKLDILVNNAGVGAIQVGGLAPPQLEETSAEIWDRIMDVNSKGVFLGTRAAIPAMRASGGGSIINISSVAGLVGAGLASGAAAAYASSKGSVRLLTKATAVQHGHEGIRCNSVHPGYIETPMTQAQMTQEGFREQVAAMAPLNRIGTVEDVANGVLFLASDESSFMTGSEMVIDGGWTAQ